MNELENSDTDYEFMDDLPLSDRIEFSHLNNEKILFEDSDDIANWSHA